MSSNSNNSQQIKNKRAPMSDAAKAAMIAKRKATMEKKKAETQIIPATQPLPPTDDESSVDSSDSENDDASSMDSYDREEAVAAKPVVKVKTAPAPVQVAAAVPATEEAVAEKPSKKERKPRAPMSAEAKAAAVEKRRATLAAKKLNKNAREEKAKEVITTHDSIIVVNDEEAGYAIHINGYNKTIAPGLARFLREIYVREPKYEAIFASFQEIVE